MPFLRKNKKTFENYCFCVIIFALNKEEIMDRTLRLTGKGEAGKAPDRIVFAIVAKGEDPDYQKAMMICDGLVGNLKQRLVDGGFKEEDIKTVDFRVRAVNKYIDSGRTTRYVFDKYEISHSLEIAFEFDRKRLAKCADILANSLGDPTFTITFGVEKDNDLKEEALRQAVEDAKAKAELLAKSADVELGEIVLIDHSFQQINIYRPRSFEASYEGDGLAKASSASLENINVKDIKVQANVTMVWEIK